jgi:hypothetical protein
MYFIFVFMGYVGECCSKLDLVHLVVVWIAKFHERIKKKPTTFREVI